LATLSGPLFHLPFSVLWWSISAEFSTESTNSTKSRGFWTTSNPHPGFACNWDPIQHTLFLAKTSTTIGGQRLGAWPG
jgi:hypothetical protein